MDLPYLDIKGANAFEPVNLFVRRFPDLNFVIALTLLKIRILSDLKAIQTSTAALGEKVPPEILDSIRDQLVNPIIAINTELLRDVKDGNTLEPHIKTIESQIEKLFDAVKEENKHFWPSLVDPGSHLTARPEYYSSGTPEQIQLALKYNYDAWAETPGAIDVIKAKLRT